MLRSCTLPLAQMRLLRLFTFWENLSQSFLRFFWKDLCSFVVAKEEAHYSTT